MWFSLIYMQLNTITTLAFGLYFGIEYCRNTCFVPIVPFYVVYNSEDSEEYENKFSNREDGKLWSPFVLNIHFLDKLVHSDQRKGSG